MFPRPSLSNFVQRLINVGWCISRRSPIPGCNCRNYSNLIMSNYMQSFLTLMKAFKDSLKINFDFGNMEEFVSQAINVWWNKFKSLSLTWEDWKTFEQKSTNILFFFSCLRLRSPRKLWFGRKCTELLSLFSIFGQSSSYLSDLTPPDTKPKNLLLKCFQKGREIIIVKHGGNGRSSIGKMKVNMKRKVTPKSIL